MAEAWRGSSNQSHNPSQDYSKSDTGQYHGTVLRSPGPADRRTAHIIQVANLYASITTDGARLTLQRVAATATIPLLLHRTLECAVAADDAQSVAEILLVATSSEVTLDDYARLVSDPQALTQDSSKTAMKRTRLPDNDAITLRVTLPPPASGSRKTSGN